MDIPNYRNLDFCSLLMDIHHIYDVASFGIGLESASWRCVAMLEYSNDVHMLQLNRVPKNALCREC